MEILIVFVALVVLAVLPPQAREFLFGILGQLTSSIVQKFSSKGINISGEFLEEMKKAYRVHLEKDEFGEEFKLKIHNLLDSEYVQEKTTNMFSRRLSPMDSAEVHAKLESCLQTVYSEFEKVESRYSSVAQWKKDPIYIRILFCVIATALLQYGSQRNTPVSVLQNIGGFVSVFISNRMMQRNQVNLGLSKIQDSVNELVCMVNVMDASKSAADQMKSLEEAAKGLIISLVNFLSFSPRSAGFEIVEIDDRAFDIFRFYTHLSGLKRVGGHAQSVAALLESDHLSKLFQKGPFFGGAITAPQVRLQLQVDPNILNVTKPPYERSIDLLSKLFEETYTISGLALFLNESRKMFEIFEVFKNMSDMIPQYRRRVDETKVGLASFDEKTLPKVRNLVNGLFGTYQHHHCVCSLSEQEQKSPQGVFSKGIGMFANLLGKQSSDNSSRDFFEKHIVRPGVNNTIALHLEACFQKRHLLTDKLGQFNRVLFEPTSPMINYFPEKPRLTIEELPEDPVVDVSSGGLRRRNVT